MDSEENHGDAKHVPPFAENELNDLDNESNWETVVIEYETDGEGFSGLGISIVDVDVGRGPDERWIFVSTLTHGGAAERNGKLQVNDQILKVDTSNLNRTTRAYANYALGNTKEKVRLEIRRAKNSLESKLTQLVQQTQAQEQKQRTGRREVTINSKSDVCQWKTNVSSQWEEGTLHVHFLDQDTYSRDLHMIYPLTERLVDGLYSLSAFTDGVLISWGGRTEGVCNQHRLVHDALCPLLKDDCYADHGFQNGKSTIVAVPPNHETGDVPAHHVLKSSDPRSSTQVQQCLIDNSVRDGKPVVCIVINGGKEVLRMAVDALENDIPVIVVKNSGGVANFISQLECYGLSDGRNRDSFNPLIEKCVRDCAWIGEDDVNRLLELHSTGVINRSVTFWDSKKSASVDGVILEALLKCEKYEHAKTLFLTMQKSVTEMAGNVPKDIRLPVSWGILFGIILQLSSPSKHSIKTFRSLMNFEYEKISRVQLLEAYSKAVDCDKTLEVSETEAEIFKELSGGRARYKQVREALHRYTDHLVATPLGCPGWKKCPRCDYVLEARDRPASSSNSDTCLPAQQELFILSLFHKNQDLTEAVLEHVKGKMAASMFASVVYKGRAHEEEDSAEKNKLLQLARHYEALAHDCFQSCCQTNEKTTRNLLTKPLDNWGRFFPLQIAIITETKALMDKDVFKTTLDKIWRGQMELHPKNRGIGSPRNRYFSSLVFQLLFLLLFSYEVLFQLQTIKTWGFVLLAIYIFDLLVHEIYQFLVGNLLGYSAFTCELRLMFRRYFTKKDNYFDLCIILLFPLGMLVFVENEFAAKLGRISLCLDVLVFCIRFLQMFVYFKNLGIFIIMAQKSIKDTMNFMLIMIMVMWGYLVASHGMLFPPPNNIRLTWSYLVEMFFTGYWQAFNNFDLQDIGVCQEVTKLEDGDCKTESHLATEYGHHLSSVLLALYLMFINVLMMNLLIAKFNNTFEKVLEKAEMHQTWHSCQLLLEHFHTPAPFSTLDLLFAPLRPYWIEYCNRYRRHQNNPDEDLDTFEHVHLLKASEALKRSVNMVSLEDVNNRLREMQDVQQGLRQQMQDVQQGLRQQMQDVLQGLQQVLEKVTPADQHSTHLTQSQQDRLIRRSDSVTLTLTSSVSSSSSSL